LDSHRCKSSSVHRTDATPPDRPDDPEYIVRLIGQVVTVSVETVRVVAALPALSATFGEGAM
jgi:predicted helicase